MKHENVEEDDWVNDEDWMNSFNARNAEEDSFDELDYNTAFEEFVDEGKEESGPIDANFLEDLHKEGIEEKEAIVKIEEGFGQNMETICNIDNDDQRHQTINEPYE